MSWENTYVEYMQSIEDPPDEFDMSAALGSRCRIKDIIDSEAVEEADRRLVELAKHSIGDPYVSDGGKEWWRNLKRIARGEYPLDKLPDHVRELAQELYYAD